MKRPVKKSQVGHVGTLCLQSRDTQQNEITVENSGVAQLLLKQCSVLGKCAGERLCADHWNRVEHSIRATVWQKTNAPQEPSRVPQFCLPAEYCDGGEP